MYTHLASTGIDFLHRKAGLTGQGVLVAVMDSGISPAADLTPNLVATYIPTDGEMLPAEPEDLRGHGTAVAGIISGTGIKSQGKFVGVAPQTKIVSIRPKATRMESGDIKEEKTLQNDAAAIRWLTAHKDAFTPPLRILNMCLLLRTSTNSRTYLSPQEHPINLAIKEAWDAGIIVVSCAGNNGPGRGTLDTTPANEPSTITVGGVDDRGTSDRKKALLWEYSSWGPTREGVRKPDFLAPANDLITVASPGSETDAVARQVKLIRQLSAQEFYDKIMQNPESFLPVRFRGIQESFGRITPEEILAQLKKTLPFKHRFINDDYLALTATSFAAPYVTGAIALLLEEADRAGKRITPDQMKAMLIDSCDQLPDVPGAAQGAGYVDFKKAYFKIHL